MKNNDIRIAVASRSFSRNPVLREELFLKYQNITFNDLGRKLEGDSLIDFLSGHDKAIIALEKIEDNILAQLPRLKVISKYGVGLDMIDLNSMCKYGVRLGWTAGVNRRSVSELVICYAIALLRHVPSAYREVLLGGWNQHEGRCLSGRTVGIIGCGSIGKDLTLLLKAFGCQVLAYDICNYSNFYTTHKVKPMSLEMLLEQSDIVTIHTPLDESTRGLLNAEKLGLLKPTAVLINIARGEIVDEQVVKEMLIANKLAGAAFDVFSVEPPQDSELLDLPNFLVTPHIGGSTNEAIKKMGLAAISGLDDNFIPNCNTC